MEETISKAPIPDNFAYVVPVDALEHTDDTPFCWNMTCPCKSDQTLFMQVQQFVMDGLLTVDEATMFYCGKTV